jgi:hypothetical protein
MHSRNPRFAKLAPAHLDFHTLADLSYGHADTGAWCSPSWRPRLVFPRSLISVAGVVLPVKEVRGDEPPPAVAVRAVCLPSTVKRLHPYSFASYLDLFAVTCEAGSLLRSIEECAFTNCFSLSSFFIPSSVEELTGFFECRSLAAVTFEPGSRLSRISP